MVGVIDFWVMNTFEYVLLYIHTSSYMIVFTYLWLYNFCAIVEYTDMAKHAQNVMEANGVAGKLKDMFQCYIKNLLKN